MTNTTTGGIAALNTARGSLTGTVMPSLTSSLNSFAALNGTLDGTLTSLSGTLDQADGLFDQLVDTLNQTKTTISSTQDSLRQVASDVATVRTDIATLDSSAAYQKIRDTLHLDDKGFGDFMGNPVTLTTKVVYATDNYGSAVTPFYTNLALWVGGFVLIAIYKLEVDREGIRRITATQAYLAAGCCWSPSDSCKPSSPPSAIWCLASNASIRCCSSWPGSSVRSYTSTLFTHWPWRSAISAKPSP